VDNDVLVPILGWPISQQLTLGLFTTGTFSRGS